MNIYAGIVTTLENEAQELNKRLVKLRENGGDFNQYIAALKSLKEVLSLITTYSIKDDSLHPIYQGENMKLPRDRRERNEWCRHFYRVDPTVANAIDLHAEFPISDFSHICSDPSIKKFFDNMIYEKLDIMNLLLNIGLEYWKIGDVFPLGQLNKTNGIWDKFTLLNPDYMDIQSSMFTDNPKIELIPDDSLKEIIKNGINGKNEKFFDIYKQLSPEVIENVQKEENIILDSQLVSHIASKTSQYDTFGTPLLMRCFKTLIYKDKLKQAQEDISIIQKELITALKIDEQYDSEVLKRQYTPYISRLESWIKNKVYKPIAEIQGFYKPVNGEIAFKYMSDKQKKISIENNNMELIIPQISWEENSNSVNKTITNFVQQLHQKGLISDDSIKTFNNK